MIVAVVPHTYTVVLYFAGSAHRYDVEAVNEADALEAALVEHSDVRAEEPHIAVRLRDFTIEVQQ